MNPRVDLGRKDAESEREKRYEKQQNQLKTWRAQGLSNKQIDERLKTYAQREGVALADFKLDKHYAYVVKFPFVDPPELRDNYICKLDDVEFHYPTGTSCPGSP